MLLVLDYAKVYVGYMVIFGLVKSENRLFFIYAFLALPGDKKTGCFDFILQALKIPLKLGNITDVTTGSLFPLVPKMIWQRFPYPDDLHV